MIDVILVLFTLTVIFFAGPFVIEAAQNSVERWADIIEDIKQGWMKK